MPDKGMMWFPGRTADEDIALDIGNYVSETHSEGILEPYPLAQRISEVFAYIYDSDRKETLDLRQQKPEIFAAVYSSMFAVYPTEERTPQRLLEAAISGFPQDIRSAIEDNILVSSIRGLNYYSAKYGPPSLLHVPPAGYRNFARLLDPAVVSGLAADAKIASPYAFSETQYDINLVQIKTDQHLLPGHIWIT
ncbi:MAG: hypothetical protein HGA85_04785, partial [Nanoarchaeota archaeon]|nr:hypothetical protein [Nanoarchaeota archaeon]